MTGSEAASSTARRDWYRQAIMSDPDRLRRFQRNLDRVRSTFAAMDDLDEIDRLLTADDLGSSASDEREDDQ